MLVRGAQCRLAADLGTVQADVSKRLESLGSLVPTQHLPELAALKTALPTGPT